MTLRRAAHYDLVILDTPPAVHAVDFLRAPERLNAVFDSAIVSLFMGRTTGLGLVATAWKQGVKVYLACLDASDRLGLHGHPR